jgi:hypothetical protein
MDSTRYGQENNYIYDLLPAIYRKRDEKLGGPLKALLAIITEQVRIVEDNIDDLSDNWFIETCDNWVVPYIGDLVGARSLNQAINKSGLTQRAYVANTIYYRRRKGTLATLEQLARDITQWNAKAIEFFKLLSITQNINHVNISNNSSNNVVDLKNSDRLELLNTPFDTGATHTVDIRQIKSKSKKGYYYNIQNIGIFLWRLKTYPIRDAPASRYKDNKRKLFFNQLGFDMPLFNHPVKLANRNNSVTFDVKEVNVPGQIGIRAFFNYPQLYYGDNNKSIKITVVDSNGKRQDKDIRDIVVCDLTENREGTDWQHSPPKGKVAVDPVRGRISFSKEDKDSEIPDKVLVNYYYGFSSEVGGGSYDRKSLFKSYDVPNNNNNKNNNNELRIPNVITNSNNEADVIKKAISKWQGTSNKNAIFLIGDSQIYTESFDTINLPPGVTLAIRAAQNQRPVIKLAKPLIINGGENIHDDSSQRSKIIFDGLVFDRSVNENSSFQMPLLSIKEEANLGSLIIEHCTLVPERNSIDSTITSPSSANNNNNNSLEVKGNDDLIVGINRTIIGGIDMSKSSAKLKVIDSIIDKKGDSSMQALVCKSVIIENSTIFGKVKVDSMDLASNTIFTDNVLVQRRQKGCMRFSYIPEGSKVPSTFRCQPNLLKNNDGIGRVDTLKVYPQFTSTRYGDPGYAQLYKDAAAEIFEGADNESEMGVFNHLNQAKRIKDLKYSLEEYMRLGLEAGIFMVT